MILRFVETSGQAGYTNVRFPSLHLLAAWQCNALEECRDSLSVSADNLTLNLKPFQIVTIRIQTDVVTHGQ
jgi:alpha-mannosidase